MKKFTKILICLMLCVMSVCLVACNNGSDKDKNFNYPPASGAVSGNGGLAVRKGNCLYFVNGYQNAKDMQKQNDSYVLGSLMIAEIDENGNVKTDENGIMKNDYINTMTDKLCGFEATNLFIGGDYLYFTSPSQENESEKDEETKEFPWAKDRVEFYRIKLNKSSKPEKIYQSTVSYENLTFKYYYVNEKTYILAHEAGESKDSSATDAIVRIDANAKSSSLVKEGVTNYIFADDANKIFYSFSQDDLYQLNQYNVVTNTSTEFTAIEENFKIVDVKANRVFISYEKEVVNKSTNLYVAEIAPKGAFAMSITGIQNFDKTYISEDGNSFIGIKGNKIKVEKISTSINKNRVTDEGADSLTYIGIVGGKLIYIDNNNMIKSFSFYNYAENGEAEIKELAKVEGIDTTYFDLDENYVYFYKTVNSKKYLHRVSLNATYVEDVTNDQMIGVYLDGDAPEIEEKEE